LVLGFLSAPRAGAPREEAPGGEKITDADWGKHSKHLHLPAVHVAVDGLFACGGYILNRMPLGPEPEDALGRGSAGDLPKDLGGLDLATRADELKDLLLGAGGHSFSFSCAWGMP